MPAVPKKKVALKVNGLEQVHEVEPRLLLVDLLRDIVGTDRHPCRVRYQHLRRMHGDARR